MSTSSDPEVVPSWPSLYWPINNAKSYNLSHPKDIWKFTVIWSLIFFTIIYSLAGILAWSVFRKYRWSFLIPVGFVTVALLTGLVGGTVVGFILAALYISGEFEISVWIPFLWGLIQAFLVLLGCFTTFTTIL
ncbi:17466_t:CDS:2, partial [Acaulospora morrowiae]